MRDGFSVQREAVGAPGARSRVSFRNAAAIRLLSPTRVPGLRVRALEAVGQPERPFDRQDEWLPWFGGAAELVWPAHVPEDITAEGTIEILVATEPTQAPSAPSHEVMLLLETTSVAVGSSSEVALTEWQGGQRAEGVAEWARWRSAIMHCLWTPDAGSINGSYSINLETRATSGDTGYPVISFAGNRISWNVPNGLSPSPKARAILAPLPVGWWRFVASNRSPNGSTLKYSVGLSTETGDPT